MRASVRRFATRSLSTDAPAVSTLQGQVDRAALASRWSVSLSAGPASESIVGVSSRMGAHALIGVGCAFTRTPLEVRVDAMAVSWASSRGYASLNANAVLPVARIPARGTVLRPCLLGGVGLAEFRARITSPAAFAAQVGGEMRLEGSKYGGFAEWRHHSA